MTPQPKRFRRTINAQRLKAKRISARMKARTRAKRERQVDVVTETPITLRSKCAWVTILLMVLVIVAASIRVHPTHYEVDYAITEVGNNPYMGEVDSQDGYLVSCELTWAQVEPEDGVWKLPEDMPLLSGGRRYVVMLNADVTPRHVLEAIADAPGSNEALSVRLNSCVRELCRLMGARGDCAYLQLERALTGIEAQIEGIYVLCRDTDGLLRAPDSEDNAWLNAPVAGSVDDVFGNRLTYVLGDAGEETLEGRIGWALGVRSAEWHSFTRPGDRLFVNLTVDNAGVVAPYQPLELALTLWKGDELCCLEVQQSAFNELTDEALYLAGFIDMPYKVEPGQYELCVSINLKDAPEVRLRLTMPEGRDGYYRLGNVKVI